MKLPAITSLLCLASMAVADEVRLKDGTVYKDCIVERETEKEVTIIVPVGKTIRDSKTIPQDQILLITKSKPDERDYADIVRRYGEVDGLNEEELEKGVTASEKFIETHKESKHLDEVRKLSEKLTTALPQEEEESDEAEKDDDGNVSEDEPGSAGRYEYDENANKILAKFKTQIKQNKPLPAMVFFDQLSQDYAASQAYAEARGIAEKVLPKVVENLGAMAAASEKKVRDEQKSDSDKTQELLRKQRDPKLNEQQKEAFRNAEKQWREELAKKRDANNKRQDMYRQKVRELRDKKLRWFNPIPEIPESMRELERLAKADLERIKQEVKYEESDKAGKGTVKLKEAWTALDAGELDKATEAVSELRSLRVPKEYWEKLDVELKAARTAAYEKARADREAERAKIMEERRKQQEERNKASIERMKKKQNKSDDKDGKGDDADKKK